jgi:subtilisin family serine protease
MKPLTASTLRPFSRGVLATALLAATALLVARAAPANEAGAPSAPAILVAFHPTAAPAQRQSAVQRLGLAADANTASPYFARLRLSARSRAAGVTLENALAALRRDPAVRVVEPDHPVRAFGVPNDPGFVELWGLHNVGQTEGRVDADIDAPEAWDLTTGSTSVIVADIDTGVDYIHPDLAGNILRDGNGNVVGYDFANNDPDPMDDHGHGTHTSGTIGALGNNNEGIVGVSPVVRIMPLKFLRADGYGDLSGAIQCIDFAREHGARIMNNSWGGGPRSQLLLESVQRARDAGVLFVAAAGNDASSNDLYPSYPASYNAECTNVLAVANSTDRDRLGFLSNFGANSVDLAAPGEEVLSTVPGGGYAISSGTSMAAPHVAGAAALILARMPSLTMAQVKEALERGADHPTGLNGKVRAGRLNARGALGAAMQGITGRVSVAATGTGLAGVVVTASREGSRGTSRTASPRMTIPDNRSSGATAAMPITRVGTLVQPFTVRVDITHPRPGDLRLTLIHPDRTQVILRNRVPGGRNLHQEFSVSVFSGRSRVGSWRLMVQDLAAGAQGRLDTWKLSFPSTTISASATTGTDGSYFLAGLAANTYVVTAASGALPFEPASRSVTVAAGLVEGVDFSTPVDPSVNYRLVAAHSGKCLDVEGGPGATQNGARLHQWTFWGGANQKWQFRPMGDAYYQVVAVHSGKCLDVEGGPNATGNGVKLIQWDYVGGDNQLWSLHSVNGYFMVRAKHSGRCLDVEGGPSASQDGAWIQQWDYWGGANQLWRLEPAD